MLRRPPVPKLAGFVNFVAANAKIGGVRRYRRMLLPATFAHPLRLPQGVASPIYPKSLRGRLTDRYARAREGDPQMLALTSYNSYYVKSRRYINQ